MLFALTSIERIDQADAASVPPLGSCQEVHDCTAARAPREPCRIRDSAVLYSRGRVRSSRSHKVPLSLQFILLTGRKARKGASCRAVSQTLARQENPALRPLLRRILKRNPGMRVTLLL
jgi:hypothetical protein